MMNLLQQDVTIVIEDVQQLSIHGSIYYQLAYCIEGQESVAHMRINPEAFYPNPQPGDRVAVSLVMGNVMSAEKLND